MRLAGGPKLLLHAQMEGHRAIAEPRAPATGQLGRLGELVQAQDAAVEGARLRLAARRHRQLHVVNGIDSHPQLSSLLFGPPPGKPRSMVSVTSFSQRALLGRARDNAPGTCGGENVLHAAEAEDAVLPEGFQRIAEDALSRAPAGRVGRVEHQAASRLEASPIGTPSPVSPSRNSYATPGRITRSIQPFRMAGGWPHQLGCTMTMPSAAAISAQCRAISGGSGAPFGISRRGQHRIEPFGVEVVEEHRVPVKQQRLPGRLGDGVIETAGAGVGQNEGELHAAPGPCSSRRSISANARARSGASPT